MLYAGWGRSCTDYERGHSAALQHSAVVAGRGGTSRGNRQDQRRLPGGLSERLGHVRLASHRERPRAIASRYVPTVENTTTVQFVMNTLNGSWCRFTGYRRMLATLGDQLYFGGTDGKVYLYGASLADNGTTAISAKLTTAFQNGGNAQTKQFLMARPVIVAPDGLVPGVAIHIDYDTTAIVVPSESFTTSGTLWDRHCGTHSRGGRLEPDGAMADH